MAKRILAETIAGMFYADKSQDPDYPGIDVEFVPKHENEGTLSRPRVLFEYNDEEKELRILVWNNPDSEDYSNEITFDLSKYIEKKN